MARAARRRVLQRDSFRCTACGATEELHVHHVVPRADGGSNDLDNLVTLCFTCHERLHHAEDGASRETVERRNATGEIG